MCRLKWIPVSGRQSSRAPVSGFIGMGEGPSGEMVVFIPAGCLDPHCGLKRHKSWIDYISAKAQTGHFSFISFLGRSDSEYLLFWSRLEGYLLLSATFIWGTDTFRGNFLFILLSIPARCILFVYKTCRFSFCGSHDLLQLNSSATVPMEEHGCVPVKPRIGGELALGHRL